MLPQTYGGFERSHPIGLGMESRSMKFGVTIYALPVDSRKV